MHSFTALSLLGCLLSTTALASPGGHTRIHSYQHHALARKHAKPAEFVERNATDVALAAHKRQANGATFTYYRVGLGACGGFNVESDYIVALNEYQWDGGAHCNQQITITVNGKSTVATITDLCPFDSCQPGQLDLSRGLFMNWDGNPEQTGVLHGDWFFGTGGNGGGQKPQTTSEPPPPPSTTEKPPPPPTTTTSEAPPPPPPTTTTTSTSETPTTTSTTEQPTTSSSSTSSESPTSTSSTESAAPTHVAPTGNLYELQQVVGLMGSIVIDSAYVN